MADSNNGIELCIKCLYLEYILLNQIQTKITLKSSLSVLSLIPGMACNQRGKPLQSGNISVSNNLNNIHL